MTADERDEGTSSRPPSSSDATTGNADADASSPSPPAERADGGSARRDYDVVLCGTDLVQSILSSALSRAGRRVLHVDGSEWYGGLDAVLHAGSTLEAFAEECGGVAAADGSDGNGEDDGGGSRELRLLPREEYGDLRMHSQSLVAAKESESDATKEDVSISPVDAEIRNLSIEEYTTEKKEETANENDVATDDGAATAASLAKESTSTQQQPAAENPLERGFCLDLTPGLLYASGDAVEDLVKSGVADYLEFKSLKGLYLLMDEEGKPSTTRGGGRRGGRAGKAGKGRAKNGDLANGDAAGEDANKKRLACYRVPCSKADVFRSKLLSPVDKRRLMKFLQLISDYGVATQFGDRPTDDETNLTTEGAEGGSSAADDADGASKDPEAAPGGETEIVQSINEHFLHRGRALSRPQNKATPSSSDLDALMRCIDDGASFATFLTEIAKLPERLAAVVTYALALAPSGSSDRYSTKDGVDDLVRHLTALGRFGDTAFLVTMYGSGELSQAFCRSGAVFGSTYMLRRSPTVISLDDDARVRGLVLSGEEHIGASTAVDTDDVSDKTITCEHVVVPAEMLRPKGGGAPRTRIYRRVSILQGKLVRDEEGKDDKDESDAEQRYAIVIPPGTGGLKNESAIHGVAVDDSVFVAPRGKDYTLLHLTTIGRGDDAQDEMVLDALSEAVEHLIASQPSREGAASVRELHHVSFSYSAETSSSGKGGDEIDSGELKPGLHVCRRGGQSLACDAAFREARRIFRRICPGSDFLALAQKVEDAIVYRDERDSDDEGVVLESACNMIEAPAADANEKTHDGDA